MVVARIENQCGREIGARRYRLGPGGAARLPAFGDVVRNRALRYAAKPDEQAWPETCLLYTSRCV